MRILPNPKAIISIIGVKMAIGIIVGVIIYSHEDGCVVESEEQAAKICWFK